MEEAETAHLILNCALIDKEKRILLKLPEKELDITPHFGGDQIPMSLKLDVPELLPAGIYEIVTKIVDKRSGKRTSSNLELKVDDPLGGIHERKLSVSYDRDGRVPIYSTQSIGQPLFFKCEFVGVKLVNEEIDLEARIELIDSKSQVTCVQLKPVVIKQEIEGELPPIFLTLDELFANRSGKFEWKMTVIDHKHKIVREVIVPLSVYSAR